MQASSRFVMRHVLALFYLLLFTASATFAQATAFTYQG